MSKFKSQLLSGTITNLHLLAALDDEYNGHERELSRLQARRKEISAEASQAHQRRSYKQLMRDLGDTWLGTFPPEDVVPQEEIPLLIDTFTKKVVLDPIASHFYTLTIHWRDPLWGIDEAVCYRDGNASNLWTEEEDVLLQQHYETASRAELLKLIPKRGYKAMVYRAMQKDLHRVEHVNEPEVPHSFSWLDWNIMLECNVTEQQLRAFKGGRVVRWSK